MTVIPGSDDVVFPVIQFRSPAGSVLPHLHCIIVQCDSLGECISGSGSGSRIASSSTVALAPSNPTLEENGNGLFLSFPYVCPEPVLV
jgi:hypothetical protein